MKHGITLGKEYVDQHTGFRGRASSIHYYEYGCERVQLESLHEGTIKLETFDLPRLLDGETLDQAKSPEPKTGGDRPTTGKSALPAR